MTANEQEVIARAANFVSWYRNMVMQGQIQVSRWAIATMPGSDYELRRDLDAMLGINLTEAFQTTENNQLNASPNSKNPNIEGQL